MSGNSSEYIQGRKRYSKDLQRSFKITLWISIITVYVISLLDLAGWLFNIVIFKSIIPYWEPMKIITAICFILSATAIMIYQTALPSILRKISARIFAAFICITSLLTLYIYFYFIRSGNESFLTSVSFLKFFTAPTLRMALLTAFNFLLIGCILFLISSSKQIFSGIAHIIIVPVVLISYFVILSYILGVHSLTEIIDVSVALNTGVAFCGLCIAIILMRTDTWLLKLYTSPYTGGIILRKLLPPLLVLPIVIGWLRIKGEHSGLFISEEGVILVAITYTACFLVLAWMTARSVNRIDLKRQATDKELHDSEERFRTISESLPVQIAITRISDSTIRFTNAVYDQTFGFKRGELIGRKAHDFYFDPEDRKKVIEVLQEHGEVNNFEAKVKKSDGSPFWIMSSIRTIAFEGKPSFLSALIDISERKKVQAELLQINRTLDAIGKSSQAMIHSGNEFQYLNDVCKIIVEDCGYSLIWIGYAQNNKDKNVEPVAYYGFEERYTELLNITWDDSDRGKGPTGIAIRTGKPSVCKNILADPDYKPWREDALKRGYASSISLPLISDGKPFGAISIYAKETDAFSDKEINLLSVLADDLSYGISFIRLVESEKKVAVSIKESEKKFRLLFDGMTEGFAFHEIILDEKGDPCDYRFLSINPAFEKQTGLKAEKIIGKKVSEVLPGTEKYWIDTYGKVALTGESIEFENYSSGLNSYYRVSAFCPDKGFFAVIFENITTRVLAEKELQSTRNYLENLINYANAPIIVWNPDSMIRLFNHAFEHLTGYSSADVEGKRLEFLFPEESLNESSKKIKDALTENWKTIEIPILTKNGEIRTVLWNSANIYETDNKTVLSTIAQGNDITERIRAEEKVIERTRELELANVRLQQELTERIRTQEALRKSEVELKELNATKDKFFNIVAHDLKNPFTSLLGSSELLFSNIDKMDHEKIKSLALILNDASKNGYAILQNLLDWSRSQAGLLKFNPERINIKDLIDEHILNLEQISANKEIIMYSEVKENIFAYADKNMIKTILRNLLSNAIKYSFRFGEVIVSAVENKHKIIISVKDSGMGIQKENLEKIFRIDAKFSVPGTEKELGTGLGLKICKEFVEKQGGKIWAESVENRGSEFKFSIPVKKV
jgi:PAS domain S-box-containing protein